MKNVCELVKYESTLNTQDKKGNTPLMLAAIKGQPDILDALLKKQSSLNLDAKNSDDNTALILAIENEHSEFAIKLIKAKPNLHIINKRGYTALHAAVEAPSVRKALLESGAAIQEEEKDKTYLNAVVKDEVEKNLIETMDC